MGNVVPSTAGWWLIGAGLETSALFGDPVRRTHRPELSQQRSKMALLSRYMPEIHPPVGSVVCLPRVDLYHAVIGIVNDVRASFLIDLTVERSILSRVPAHTADFVRCCDSLNQTLNSLLPNVKIIEPRTSEFDIDDVTPGNGFRSVLAVVDSCLLHILRLCFRIRKDKSALTFKSGYYYRELLSYAQALASLEVGVAHTKDLIIETDPGNLFPDTSQPVVNEILVSAVENVCQEPFYGRCVGFQFYPSMWRPLQVVSVAMATFSEGFLTVSPSSGKPSRPPAQTAIGRLASALLSTGHYLMSPEKRAKRNVVVTRTANVQFCKAFWALSEQPFIQSLATQRLPSLAINHVIQIDTRDCSQYLSHLTPEHRVEIRAPADPPHLLPVRLLSYKVRRGMVENSGKGGIFFRSTSSQADPSPYLVFHCHGGGFIGQSSKAHEVYLLTWAKELNIPILSVDYSLAPEYPYPRAFEEVVFAYAWAINNAARLGWSGEKIVMTGDSAGGLLVTACCLKLLDLGVARMPDGLVPIYTPFLVEYSVSPSRFLCLLDPLLPLGILVRCLAAYTGNSEDPAALNPNQSQTPSPSPPSAAKQALRRDSWPRQAPLARVEVNRPDTMSLGAKGSLKTAYINLAQNAEHETKACTGSHSMSNISGVVSAKNEVISSDSSPSALPAKKPAAPAQSFHDQPQEVKKPKFTLYNSGAEGASSPGHRTVSERGSSGTVTPSFEHKNGNGLDLELDPAGYCDEEETFVTPSSEMPLVHKPGGSDSANAMPKTILCRTKSAANGIDSLKARRTISLQSSIGSYDSAEDVMICSSQVVPPVTRDSCSRLWLSTEGYEKDFVNFLRDCHGSAGADSLLIDGALSVPEETVSEWSELGSGFRMPEDLDQVVPSTARSHRRRKPSIARLRYSASFSFGESLTSMASYLTQEVVSGYYQSWQQSANGGPANPPCSIMNGSPSGAALNTIPEEKEGPESYRPSGTSMAANVARFQHMYVPKTPFMSPYYALDADLAKLPPVFLIACHLDPLLDDNIMFGRRLQRAGVLASMDLVDSLPHGFLNFSPVSAECRAANRLCIRRLAAALGMPDDPPAA